MISLWLLVSSTHRRGLAGMASRAASREQLGDFSGSINDYQKTFTIPNASQRLQTKKKFSSSCSNQGVPGSLSKYWN